jgi:4-carboxymuconolactone decarboxylase
VFEQPVDRLEGVVVTEDADDANDALTRGRAIQARLWPRAATASTGQFPAARLAPDFYRYVAESAFGMIWSRPGLAIRDRSLVTVAQLAALGRTSELRAHLAGALNVGLTREELVEVLMQTAVYAGVPAANEALNVAAEVLGTDEAEDHVER